MSEKIRVAVIGLGSRGTVYSSLLSMKDEVELVAGADIDPAKVARFSEKYHVPMSCCYASGEELLAQEKLADVAVIAVWDRLHAAMATEALKKGYHLLLEKPIAPVLEDCLAVEKLAKALNREVIVCHVLRYTPFYSTLKKVLDSGEIGRVVNVQAVERVGYWHQAHSFVRGNWRNAALSSPMLLQKSCHDLDMFLWLTGKHCKTVSSMGSLTWFTPENAPEGAAERCFDCQYEKTCPYSGYNAYIRRAQEEGYFQWPTDVVTQVPTVEALKEALKTGPYGRCVFRCDNDVVDHQVTNMLMEDGVTVTFSMCALTSKTGRFLHIMGTEGDITGEMDENLLTVTRFGQAPKVINTALAGDVFGHGGGDEGLVNDLVGLFTGGNASASRTGIEVSVESHVVALAAEESRLAGGKAVDIEAFRAAAEEGMA